MEPRGCNRWNGWQFDSPSKPRKQANPLPPAATSCLRRSMVRRGSPVRVRKRALQKRRTSALFRSRRLARHRTRGGYGALYGAFRSGMLPLLAHQPCNSAPPDCASYFIGTLTGVTTVGLVVQDLCDGRASRLTQFDRYMRLNHDLVPPTTPRSQP